MRIYAPPKFYIIYIIVLQLIMSDYFSMRFFFPARDIVLTSGRDGTVRRFAVVDGGIQEVSVTHMAAAWVALLIKPGRRSPLLAALFHGSKLVFQSLASQETVGEISCGGGHRSWALLDRRYVIYIKVGSFTLLCLKCKKFAAHLLQYFIIPFVPQ